MNEVQPDARMSARINLEHVHLTHGIAELVRIELKSGEILGIKTGAQAKCARRE